MRKQTHSLCVNTVMETKRIRPSNPPFQEPSSDLCLLCLNLRENVPSIIVKPICPN